MAEEPAPAPEPAPEPAADGAGDDEVTATWESKYKDLKEVKVESGEEKEDILFKMRCKLFHFLKAEEKYGGAMEWKEKGVGALASPPAPCRCTVPNPYVQPSFYAVPFRRCEAAEEPGYGQDPAADAPREDAEDLRQPSCG